MFSGSETPKRWTQQCLVDMAHCGQGLHTIKSVSLAWSERALTQSYGVLTASGESSQFSISVWLLVGQPHSSGQPHIQKYRNSTYEVNGFL